MKKIYLLSSLILFALSTVKSQPTINDTDFNPYQGLSAKYWTFTPFPFDGGPSGANATWDFSGALYNDSAVLTFLDPATTTHASSFPLADIASEMTGIGFEFLITSSTGIELTGYDGSNSGLVPYSNPETIITFPFTLNSTYTDSFAGTYTSGGYQFFRNGTVSATADSYGTLMLPWGSIQNVLRIHYTENWHDSAVVAVLPYISDNYLYVTPGTHTKLLKITKIGNNFAGFYIDASGLGINPIEADKFMKVYPSPASKFLNINFNSGEKIIRTKIMDVTGKVVYQDEDNSVLKQKSINISLLTAGSYFLNVETDGKTFTKKFVKE